MNNPLKLSDLIKLIGGELVGDDVEATGFSSIETANSSQITFVAQAKYRTKIAASHAGALVLKPEWRSSVDRPSVLVANPYAWFARAQAIFHPTPKAVPGIHPTATVSSAARVHETAEIGANVSIGAGASIGAHTVLHPGVVIGAGVTVGADTCIYPNVVVYHDCVLGDRCIVHSGAVIGADGFGFAQDAGTWVKIPQVGRVVIGNDVEIGANTTIDRGAIGDTVIADDVKLDNLIMIAHNIEIGSHSAIAGCTGIAGSTTIGESCTIGGACMISGHLQIGDRVHIAGGSLVAKSLEGGKAFTGYPLAETRDWQKNAVHLRHLDEMAKTIKELQKRLEDLERASS